ncbi:MAG TPA: hypothetical protein VGC26_09340, partial [Afipia sp.]
MLKSMSSWPCRALIPFALLASLIFGDAALAQRIPGFPMAAPLTGLELTACAVPNGAVNGAVTYVTKACSVNSIAGQTTLTARAQKILRAAARGTSPITGVMSSPPTITIGADYAQSTIITTATAQ